MLTALATYDLALTYALRRPKLAASLARESATAAIKCRRPDLAFAANNLLAALGAS